MLSALFTGTVRYRRQILATAVVLAASVLVLRAVSAPQGEGGFALRASLDLLALASAVLAIVAGLPPRPATLTVDPRKRAFRTSLSARFVYLVVMLTSLSTAQIGSVGFLWSFMDAGQGPRHLGTVLGFVLAALQIGLFAVPFVWVWRGVELELRPDGLTEHGLLGTLTVPWEALAPGYPRLGDGSLVLAYARPELVCRRHIAFSRRRILTDSVHPAFLGAVIAHYVAYPQHRPAIGTHTEYDRLLHALTNLAGPLPATWH